MVGTDTASQTVALGPRRRGVENLLSTTEGGSLAVDHLTIGLDQLARAYREGDLNG